jgi:hypothetical protein
MHVGCDERAARASIANRTPRLTTAMIHARQSGGRAAALVVVMAASVIARA